MDVPSNQVEAFLKFLQSKKEPKEKAPKDCTGCRYKGGFFGCKAVSIACTNSSSKFLFSTTYLEEEGQNE